MTKWKSNDQSTKIWGDVFDKLDHIEDWERLIGEIEYQAKPIWEGINECLTK